MRFNRISLDGIHRRIDAACLILLGNLEMLALVFPGRVLHAGTIGPTLFAVGTLFYVGARIIRQIPDGFLFTALQAARVIGLFSFLDNAMKDFQLILTGGWMDKVPLSMERAIFGTEISVLVHNIANPYLTEGLMFSYVAYAPLLLAVAVLCYSSKGSKAAGQYLLNLSVTFALCFLGFMLFPLASPTFRHSHALTVPLDGGLFTWCANWIHTHYHYPGGSLPSPHCAGTTIMLVMLYRYNRRAFYVLLPTLAGVYFATVYGQFHYMWDGIAGITVALGAVRLTPALCRLGNTGRRAVIRGF